MRQNSGFTLIELLVTIAVASILLATALPNFRSTIQNNRVTGQANEFLTSLTLARSEAVKRAKSAHVCISTDGATCTGGDWALGWLTWVSGNAAGTWDTSETTLRVHAALPTGSTLTEAAALSDVQFNPDGSAAAPATFTLTASGCTGNQVRTISVSPTGRSSIALSPCP